MCVVFIILLWFMMDQSKFLKNSSYPQRIAPIASEAATNTLQVSDDTLHRSNLHSSCYNKCNTHTAILLR